MPPSQVQGNRPANPATGLGRRVPNLSDDSAQGRVPRKDVFEASSQNVGQASGNPRPTLAPPAGHNGPRERLQTARVPFATRAAPVTPSREPFIDRLFARIIGVTPAGQAVRGLMVASMVCAAVGIALIPTPLPFLASYIPFGAALLCLAAVAIISWRTQRAKTQAQAQAPRVAFAAEAAPRQSSPSFHRPTAVRRGTAYPPQATDAHYVEG